jgi:hypothetical protein
MDDKKKVLGFYIKSDCRLKQSEIITGFNTRNEAESFAIEFGLKFAKILPILEG